ncbi:hypothetical protein QT969_25770 [Rhodococcus sp. CSLK01-03]|uniref:Uncharacterized protein n=1 Tax=Rhodococcus indonesiensis TaxID=3055869 RepID=A0ABT7RVL1_9NOCA|nr:hypothetical protein [Rhodococcus indonesiensis]MDM7491691.1 hypothetical protein [Rhodococcus indonesiensis]
MTESLCSTPDCTRPVKARGVCPRCYSQARRDGRVAALPKAERPSKGSKPPCSKDGYERPHHGRGLCSVHLNQLRRSEGYVPATRRPEHYTRLKVDKDQAPVEVYRPVPLYPRYQISTLGNVRHFPPLGGPPKPVRARTDELGVKYVMLVDPGRMPVRATVEELQLSSLPYREGIVWGG